MSGPSLAGRPFEEQPYHLSIMMESHHIMESHHVMESHHMMENHHMMESHHKFSNKKLCNIIIWCCIINKNIQWWMIIIWWFSIILLSYKLYYCQNSETTIISPTSPKNDGIGFRLKRLPLLEGFSAFFLNQHFFGI